MHIPVLLEETIEALDPRPNENFVDCTFGGGGHSLEILNRIAPFGKVLGIELDRQSLAALPPEVRNNPRLIIENDSYANIAAIVRKHNFQNIGGMLFDLGMSSWHVDESKKGFSFSKDEPLDMRYDADGELTAAQIINEWSAADLEKIFTDFGQERFAKKIAIAIVKMRVQRKIETTRQLAELIGKIVPPEQRIHCWARIFQSLRIAVNREFENIEIGIAAGFEILENGGRMAAITFHSLEDGIVKRKFKELAAEGRAIMITKKLVVCGPEEANRNPRARSAKLRAILKIG